MHDLLDEVEVELSVHFYAVDDQLSLSYDAHIRHLSTENTGISMESGGKQQGGRKGRIIAYRHGDRIGTVSLDFSLCRSVRIHMDRVKEDPGS